MVTVRVSEYEPATRGSVFTTGSTVTKTSPLVAPGDGAALTSVMGAAELSASSKTEVGDVTLAE